MEEEESERGEERREAISRRLFSSLLFSLFLRVHKTLTSCTFFGRPHRELVDVGNNADDSEDNFGRGVHVQN